MKLWQHSRNELRRALALKRRYWFESLLGLGFLLSLFGGLLYAVLSVSGNSLASGEVDGLILGFALWLFAMQAFSSASDDVREETEQRSLEQLCMAPLSLPWLLGLRALLGLLGGLLMLTLTLMLIQVLGLGRLQLDLGLTVGLALLAAPALMGLGYAVAGTLLLVKKGELLLVATFPLVMGLVALPAYPLNGWSLLPYALGAAAAKAAVAGTPLPPELFAWVALNSALYLALGLLVYRLLERQARRLGVLGHF